MFEDFEVLSTTQALDALVEYLELDASQAAAVGNMLSAVWRTAYKDGMVEADHAAHCEICGSG